VHGSDHDLEFVDGSLPDTDPDVIEGMRRRRELLAAEGDIPEISG